MLEEDGSDLVAPPLPVRASIYIAPDGSVHFGALFAELVPVAAALGGAVKPTDSAESAAAPYSASASSKRISPPKAAR